MVNWLWAEMVHRAVRFGSFAMVATGLLTCCRFVCRLSFKSLKLGAMLVSMPVELKQHVLVTRTNVLLFVSEQLFALAESAVLCALRYVAFILTKFSGRAALSAERWHPLRGTHEHLQRQRRGLRRAWDLAELVSRGD